LWCCGPLGTQAVIDANSQAKTNAPPDGAPWANVGMVNYASGIYIGGGWALTVYHVGPGNLILGGVTYPFDGAWQRVTNANGSFTDLVMFRLGKVPNLPRLPLAASPPGAYSAVDVIGYGRIAAGPQTTIGNYTGFYWTTGLHKSWGNNRVNAGGLTTINAGLGDLVVFITDFTAPGPTQATHESQAAQGDSGGAVFQLNGSSWQLAGVLDTISTLQNQDPDTAVYGNLTYSANISTYRAQMAALVASTIPSLAISCSGPNVRLSWLDTGVTYSLQATPTLSPPAWTTLTPSLSLTNGQYSALLPATNATRFFRLRK